MRRSKVEIDVGGKIDVIFFEYLLNFVGCGERFTILSEHPPTNIRALVPHAVSPERDLSYAWQAS